MRHFIVVGLLAAAVCMPGARAAEPQTARPRPPAIRSLGDTVVKMPLAQGVSLADAAESMKLRANLLNMKLVAELPLSKQVEAITGKPERLATIYQFCDALTARRMLDYSLDFAAYLPCRIALVEDEKGQGWLVMMDLNLLINAANLQPELKAKAIEVRDNLENIMRAGANGDL
jgi:uncharacterized protein (DUF302 family)